MTLKWQILPLFFISTTHIAFNFIYRSVPGSRMDTMGVDTMENRPRSGSLFSSPVYTPVGFENIDSELNQDNKQDYNFVTNEDHKRRDSNKEFGSSALCRCPIHGMMTTGGAKVTDIGVQATESQSDGHVPPSDVKGTLEDDNHNFNPNGQETSGNVTHSLACTLL